MEKNKEGCSSILVGLIVLGIPLGIAFWGFSLTTDGFINGKIGLVVFGFFVMLMCFWIGFDHLFNQIYRKAKGAGWMIAALVLSLLASVFLVRDFFDPKSFISTQRAVSVVCQGENVPAAGVYQSGNDPHIVLMRGVSANEKFNSEWKPGSLGDVELVICLGSPTYTLIETCLYSTGGRIKRYRENQPVRLMIAQTGEVLASSVLTANPGACPSLKVNILNPKLRGSVTNGLIEKWVLRFLPSRTYTPTPAPTGTPAPTTTPLPIEVSFDTIGNYPKGGLVYITGYLVLFSNIYCDSECGLLLAKSANSSNTITIFVRVAQPGVEPVPNQMKALPDLYEKWDVRVRLNDGTYAFIGQRIIVTGRICKTTDGDSCISDITKIELAQ